MSLGIQHLRAGVRCDTPGGMDEAIRKVFRAERKRRKLNQETVGERGGIDQATVSKIESDADYEPSLSVFGSAVRGLGISMSDFFLQIEGHGSSKTVSKPTHGGAVAIPPADEATARAVLAVGAQLAESIENAIARLVDARRQTATPRGRASPRP